LWLMLSLLWELYELSFCYELYALDRVIVGHLWSTDEAQLNHQTCLYSIFPGESCLLMWLEPLPQEPCDLGMCTSSMEIALPYLNNFRELLSAWPGAPSHLQSPAQMDGKGNQECFKLFLTASEFYIQTAFDFFGR
ncbi:hypothetical protein SCLCIDRAFT_136028, partial [Scleroderma citrinum Foug A]